VLFIDTGELLGGALAWLRDATKASGRHVVWVMGLRLEAESDGGPGSTIARFRREIHDTRLRLMPLSSFDDRTARDCLAATLDPGLLEWLDMDAVMQLTRGIPLALDLAGRLLAGGQDPADALAPVRDGEVSQVIRDLARRYLVHVKTVHRLAKDLPMLYGLALVSGTGRQDHGYPWHEPELLNRFLPREEKDPAAPLDPEILAALWDVRPPEVAGLLDDLAARHDFVLSSRRRLHQEVRQTILAYLLDPVQRPEAIEMNTRAAACYRARAGQPDHRSVDAQLADEQWQADMTALLWHTLWVSPDAGIGLLYELTRAALAAEPRFAEALADCAGFFTPACPPRHQQLITAIQAMSRRWTSRPGALEVQQTVKALTAPAVDPVLAPSPPPAAYSDLLRARYAEELGLTGPECAALLVRAARKIPAGGPTSRALVDVARALAGRASDYSQVPAKDQQVIVSALRLITRDTADDSYTHIILGNALYDLGQYAEAAAAYRDAVRADPDYAIAHNGLGNTLYNLERYAEAEAAYRDALRANRD